MTTAPGKPGKLITQRLKVCGDFLAGKLGNG
jgi:hypothetical protein